MRLTRRFKRRTLIIAGAVLILAIGAGATAYAVTTSFSDVPTDYWAYNSITKMAAQGVIQGHTDGNFGPDEFVTRAQTATFLDRSQQVCTQCHNATTLITGKQAAWSTSLHGTGLVFIEDGSTTGCTGCHSGGGFSAMVAAGQNPTQVTAGDPNPTRQDCRACHQIHATYTQADWGLETTAPVALYAAPGNTFDGGQGNLCAVCHEPRTAFPAAVDGQVTVSAHFGPHHGPESALLLGIGAADAPAGTPHFHYSTVANTCVHCHMGDTANHTFLPDVSRCQTCHPGATSFDIDGVQTKVQGMLADLKTALTTAGLLDANGNIVAGKYPEKQAAALWNYSYIKDDKSSGVHNPPYSEAVLQASLDLMK